VALESIQPQSGDPARVRRRRTVGLVACGVLLFIFLGCMSIAIGNRTPDGVVLESGTLVQKGEAVVPSSTELDIYYPIPYARPPNLELDTDFEDGVLVAQQEDHFRVRNTHAFRRSVKWTARGIRATEPAPVAAPEPPGPPPPEPVHAQ
jgi:hypothetical protein